MVDLSFPLVSPSLRGSDGYRDTGRAVLIVWVIAVTPQGIPDAIERRALRVEPYEGVDVHGHADGAVSQDFHDHSGVGALFVEQGRAGVAQVMKADLTDSHAGAQRLKGTVQVARLNGVPFFVVKTRPCPVPFQLVPTAFRSAICCARWARSAVMHSAGRATRRAERCVFGATISSSPATRCRACRTVRTPSWRSTSDQRSPSSSPRRRPMRTASSYAAQCRLSRAAARS